MDRLFFDVVAAGFAWQVLSRDGEPWAAPLQFATRERAVAAAIRLSRAEWKSARRPTGVRVALGGGTFHTMVVFGTDAPHPTLVALASQRGAARVVG